MQSASVMEGTKLTMRIIRVAFRRFPREFAKTVCTHIRRIDDLPALPALTALS
jgi:hypothetical protein